VDRIGTNRDRTFLSLQLSNETTAESARIFLLATYARIRFISCSVYVSPRALYNRPGNNRNTCQSTIKGIVGVRTYLDFHTQYIYIYIRLSFSYFIRYTVDGTGAIVLVNFSKSFFELIIIENITEQSVLYARRVTLTDVH